MTAEQTQTTDQAEDNEQTPSNEAVEPDAPEQDAPPEEQGDADEASELNEVEDRPTADPESGVRYWWLPADQVTRAWRHAMLGTAPEDAPNDYVLTGFLVALLEPVLDVAAAHVWEQARQAVGPDFPDAQARLDENHPLREERLPSYMDAELVTFDEVQELLRLVAKDTWQTASTVIAELGEGPASRMVQVQGVMPSADDLVAHLRQLTEPQHD